MKALFRPDDETIQDWLQELKSAPLTYPASEHDIPAGYQRDGIRCRLGEGQAVWERACLGIRDWKMFPRQMATLRPATVPIEVGQIISVSFRAGPMLTLNPARIVEVINISSASNCEPDGDQNQNRDGHLEHNDPCGTNFNQIDRFGFAYGTLPGHIERGREQFLVEWDHTDDSVWYSIDVFSRPAFWLIWLGYPYARWQQARFRRLSAAALLKFCSEDSR